jgi:hypothetical protein
MVDQFMSIIAVRIIRQDQPNFSTLSVEHAKNCSDFDKKVTAYSTRFWNLMSYSQAAKYELRKASYQRTTHSDFHEMNSTVVRLPDSGVPSRAISRFSEIRVAPLVALLLLLALGLSVHAAVYSKIEASFNITGLSTDPFDYAVTDVRVQILQPDSTVLSLPAFFDGATTWRVRHAPLTNGIYQVSGITMNGQPVSVSNLQPGSWTVAGTPISPGYVRVDSANTNKFITSNGRRFFPVGQDLAWDTSSTTNVVGSMAKLGAAHENWARIWTDDWDGKNLDWPKVGGVFGQLSLTVAQKWDAIVAAADQNGVAFQMTLQHHGQYSTAVDPEWSSNPYNSANGGFLTDATQFFTNATAKALTKRKFRYEIARWGYSPSIMAWELFNEVQFTDAARAGMWNIVGAWHDEMAQFIRSQDPYQHLICTSSELDAPIWNQCDFYTHHDYPTDPISAFQDPPGVPSGQPVKPIFGAESGSDSTPYYGVGAPLWAGLMGAQSGNAQPWYWDRIDAEGDYPLLRSVRDFVSAAGLAEQDGLARTGPHVTCPQNSSLVFSPGGGWGWSTNQDTFTVGEIAPPGIGTLPSYLQGTYHRSMTPNGFTFIVNYPPGGGTFSVQIITIASSGAGLQITVDNTTTNLASFPAAGSDQNTNFTMSVSVAAGQHTVRLYNPGLDWVNLGYITLDPYVPILGAYEISNTNFAALWLWHRTNIYNATASATVSGSFPLTGLNPGSYSGTWWDTFAGAPITKFTFSVAGTNPVTISTPSILRSAAFYAGPSAQAGIAVPALSRSLGTNTPRLVLPITITNSGGLPLAYSLSVTGLSSVAYVATTSTQLGGPVYAWKDFSATGRDITTNFIALTGKTASDEGIAGPIDIGFGFPFFSGPQSPGVFTQLYVSPNGFVTFNPFGGDTSTNRALPGAQAPTNMIAFFWDDLDLSTTGHVYVDSDPFAGAFTLQFQNVRFKGSASTVTCQLILKTSGEILMQYKSMATSNACTVGLQNAAGNQGLQLAFNQNFLQNNFCIRMIPANWFDLTPNAGLVPKGNIETINIFLNPINLPFGTYRATLLAKSSDFALPIVIPVALDVSSIASWRQTYFGSPDNSGPGADNADPDHDGLLNIFEYAFNSNPKVSNAPPVRYAVTNDHFSITFTRPHPAPPDITYLFDLTSDLSSGIWQSGPTFLNQNVVDNHDGTETVTVTEIAAASASPARFLRTRISRP